MTPTEFSADDCHGWFSLADGTFPGRLSRDAADAPVLCSPDAGPYARDTILVRPGAIVRLEDHQIERQIEATVRFAFVIDGGRWLLDSGRAATVVSGLITGRVAEMTQRGRVPGGLAKLVRESWNQLRVWAPAIVSSAPEVTRSLLFCPCCGLALPVLDNPSKTVACPQCRAVVKDRDGVVTVTRPRIPT